MTDYTLYIDESGDAGINKVRTAESAGASQYMTMGGILIPNQNKDTLREQLNILRESITGKNILHCNRLNHDQKVRLSQFLNTQQVLCFGVISLKETLGSYKKEIEGDSSKYYNKCSQYLLERVGIFLEEKNIPKENVSIVFEKGNFNYGALKSLLRFCQSNPQRINTQRLKRIDLDNISVMDKSEEALLQLADVVAHSLYKCVDGGELLVTETRYLNEMRTKFFQCSESGRIVGKGVYAVHNLESLKLETENGAFLEAF